MQHYDASLYQDIIISFFYNFTNPLALFLLYKTHYFWDAYMRESRLGNGKYVTD